MINLLESAKTIFKAAISAGNPEKCVNENLKIKRNKLLVTGSKKYIDLSLIKSVIVVGAGKATANMAKAIENIFLNVNLPLSGIISVKYGYSTPLERIRIIEAGHPFPDNEGKKAAEMIVKLLKNAGKDDLVISLISGGGSALLPSPSKGISMRDKIKTTELLLQCGADIEEINVIRKHISQIKGGRLAQYAFPAKVINFLLSDVLGDRMDIIASGPFVPDTSTFEQAQEILKKYNIDNKIPESVMKYIEEGSTGRKEETPKKDNPVFQQVITRIIGSNKNILYTAKASSERLGFSTLLLSSVIKGEARELGTFLASIAIEIKKNKHPIPPPACIIAGGETTVKVKGTGIGGRNQECALSAAKSISEIENILVFCAGTDGTDGPTDAAGAYCTGKTVKTGIQTGLDIDTFLAQNDSYNYFKKTDGLIITGPTKTNLMDIYMVLVGD